MDSERAARQRRLRWHCRRALLELDLVFQRFWERQAGELDAATESALARLLALEDHDLWALVSGKEATDDPQLRGMIEQLRSA